jgi:hypothetical protein
MNYMLFFIFKIVVWKKIIKNNLNSLITINKWNMKGFIQ